MTGTVTRTVTGALAVLSVTALAACSGGGSGQTATASASGAVTASPSVPGQTAGTATGGPSPAPSTSTSAAAPPVETAKPSVAVSTAPPVSVGRATPLRAGVVVTVGRPRAITVSANGPGEIAGPALVVPVTVRNDTSRSVDLGGLVVNASYGSGAGTPASPSDARPAAPLHGALAAGRSGVGQYVFMAPATAASRLRIEVSSDDTARILVFRS